MGFVDGQQHAILDRFFRSQTWDPPAQMWIGLAAAGNLAANGATFTEVTGGSYARVQAQTADFDAAAADELVNNAEFAFPEATANWGTIAYWAVFSASSGGTPLFWGKVTPNKVVNSGAIAKFSIGQLKAKTIDEAA